MELEHEQLVKGVNKCKLEKKILLVERLIGTEKRRENILNDYMTLVNSKAKKILVHLALSYNT